MPGILVIEDDATLRGVLRMHLSAIGYKVRVSADATEAIQMILAELPDLILSDLGMPYLDGLELLKALKGDELTKKVPVVLLTGRNDDETYIRATQLGAAGYVTKPVKLDELLAAIKRALPAAPKP